MTNLKPCAPVASRTNKPTVVSNVTRSLRNWYATLVRSFRISPAQFAAGAAASYSPRCPAAPPFPSFAGYLTTFRKIVSRPDSRIERVDLHGSMHDVTYVLPRTHITVRTLAMMGWSGR